jgi:hypothetical protein
VIGSIGLSSSQSSRPQLGQNIGPCSGKQSSQRLVCGARWRVSGIDHPPQCRVI